jgi:hypothetical protein
MMTESTIAQFNELRVLIEREVASPAVIVVTSATATDGASFAAFGIADSLAASAHRTLLVRALADEGSSPVTSIRKAGDDRRAPRAIGENGLLTIDAIEEGITSTSGRDSVNETLRGLREHFAYVVVDAGALPKRPIVSLLASFSEATIVALRTGRSRCADDALVARAIESKTFTVLGVVATAKPAIEAFDRMDLEPPAKLRLRNVGSVAATT